MNVKHPIVAVGFGLLLALTGAPRSAAAADDDATSSKVSVRVTDKGVVIAQVKVSNKTAAVREVLASAERSHNLAPTTVSSHATRDGDCEKVKLAVRGLIAPFQLETRRCPTATGYLETMISSNDFLEYRNEWEFKDLGAEGTLITFKTRTLPNVQVPESLILMETKRVLTRLMKNLVGALGEG
jgi:ribosome-associated toxin RatA of RatAB toxin-antitoxin module